MSNDRNVIRASSELLRRLERGSSPSFDRLKNAISSKNTATDLGIHTTTPTSYVDEVLHSFPRGYWRLGESSGTVANDYNVRTDALVYAGTYAGSYTLGAAGALTGVADTAVSFTGGRVDLPSASVWAFLRTNQFGAEMWVKATGGTNGALISNVDNGTTTKRGWEVSYNAGTDTLTFHLSNDQAGGNRLAVTTTHNLHDGSWHHLWVQYDGTSTAAGVKIYVDNVLKTNTTVVSGLTGTTSVSTALTIAGRPGGPYTTVSLDEVAVYTQTWSAQYVDWHYKAGLGQEVQK